MCPVVNISGYVSYSGYTLVGLDKFSNILRIGTKRIIFGSLKIIGYSLHVNHMQMLYIFAPSLPWRSSDC